MKSGGIADKLGNRYEAKWTVYKLLQVINSSAQGIKIEGIDKKFSGFEFAVYTEHGDEWHQCKINAPNGNWTISALKREGILGAFKDRLSKDQDCKCFFVSQDNARDLRDLSEEARLSADANEFEKHLAEGKKENFKKILTLLIITAAEAYDYLKRIYVTVFPEREITEAISQLANHLFQTNVDAFPVLRDHIEENLNQILDTDALREWINARSDMQFKAWVNPVTLKRVTHDATQRYLDSYVPFGIDDFSIARSQSLDVIKYLDSASATNLVLVTGSAGAGKSGVLRQVIEERQDKDIPILAFRVDRCLDLPTARSLGNHLLFRDETPTSLLKSISGEQRAVLVIDQLDAVSEVSGRDGRVKDAVFELVREAVLFGGIDLIIACRTFDFENDDRFRSLQSKVGILTSKVEVNALDWESEIVPVLEHIEVSPDMIQLEQRVLLSSPVNLAVFAEIRDPKFTFKSRTELFAKLTESKQRQLLRTGRGWNLFEALTKITNRMSDQQQLSVPRSVLDSIDGSRDWLLSENIMVESGDQLGFFHESYFDFIYARSFTNSGKSVSELLASSEQHLFRRTQVRQILAAIREENYLKFCTQLVELLSNDKTRFHIKLSVAQWISSVENLHDQELEYFLKESEDKTSFGPIERNALFTTANTFALLEERCVIQKELSSSIEARRRVVLNWLSNIAGEYPSQIASILRIWWGSDPKKAEELVDWFGFIRRNKPDAELLFLCKDIILSKPENLFRDDGRDRLMMLLSSWVEHNPEMCGGIIETLFTIWFEMNPDRNLADGQKNPLLDQHSLGELAKKSPIAFVEGTSAAIERTIKEVATGGREGPNWFKLSSRYKSSYEDGLEGILSLFETSLGLIVKSDPSSAESLLHPFPPELHIRCVSFHLNTISANPKELGYLLIPLLNVEGILHAGWNGAEWKVFADCARAVLRSQPKLSAEIEGFIFKIFPEIERAKYTLKVIKEEGESDFYTRNYAIHQLNQTGFNQFNILETIGDNNLSDIGKIRLQQLRRKFPKRKATEEHVIMAKWVGSPIRRNKCERMSDKQWLSAIAKYTDDTHRHYHADCIDGGARQLSAELEEQAKLDPNRFLQFLLQLPLDSNQQYFRGLLSGIAQSDQPDPPLVEEALSFAVKNFRNDLDYLVLDVIRRHPNLIEVGVIQNLVFEYTQSGKDPSKVSNDSNLSRDKILSVEDIISSSERLIVGSANGGRAKAWKTIEQCLWKVPKLTSDVWGLVFERIASEPLVAVRGTMFQALIPLFNEDKVRYERAVRLLFEKTNLAPGEPDPLQIMGTRDGVRMHSYIGFNFPEFTDELIQKMMTSSNEPLSLIGAWWLFCESFREGGNQDQAYAISNESEQHRVLYANIIADFFKWTEYRTLAEKRLLELFKDSSSEVLKQASHVFRGSAEEDFLPFMELAKQFIETPAFLEGSLGLLHAMEDAKCDVSSLVIRAAERLLESIIEKGDQHGSRSISLHQMQDLLRREYASSDSKPAIRSKILDIIDFMLEKEIYGVDSLLAQGDR